MLVKEPETIRETKFFKVREMEELSSQIHDKVLEYALEKLNTYESKIVHLIGKEIVRFHAIY